MNLTPEIPLIIWVLTGVFSLFSTILAFSTLSNVFRLRNVRMDWKAGKLKGYPLFSTLFLGSNVVLMAVGLYHQAFGEWILAGLYLLLATGWFVTSYLASKRYITNNGIVKNVNDPSQTIAWHQIRDFVEKKSQDGNGEFIFFYSEDSEPRPEKMIRLELTVPASKLPDFKKLISHKLGRRITCYETESIRVEQFD